MSAAAVTGGRLRAATPVQRVLAQARFEVRTLLGNGEQLLVSIGLPVIALFALVVGSTPDLGPGPRVDIVAPGVLALAVVSTAFTGQAIAAGFDRRSGVLRLLGTTPLGRSGLLGARVLAVLVVEAMQVAVLAGLSAAYGWRPGAGTLLTALVWFLLGTATFVALALALAGTLRAEGVLAVANLLWVLMLGLGTVLPANLLPGSLETLARLTPGGALGELLRGTLTGAGTPYGELLVLGAWLLVGLTAVRWFRWDD